MTNNFILLYNGREGSSAIISALNSQKGVYVPLFEELDDYIFLKSHKVSDYPEVLDEVFTKGSYSGPRHHNGYLQAPRPAAVQALGFKWRAAGNPRAVAKVLKKHDVTLFSLHRKSFLNLVCSVYVHDYADKIQSDIKIPSYPQFTKELALSEAEVKKRLSALNEQTFSFNKALFLRAAWRMKKTRQILAQTTRALQHEGAKASIVYYEDFDRDPQAVVTSMLQKIGLETGSDYVADCEFEKVHKTPISERIQGLEPFLSSWKSWKFRQYERAYQAAISSIAKKADSP